MPWDDIKLDNDVPLPPGTYVATVGPDLSLVCGRISNFRPCQQYKTWPSAEHAAIALRYLEKHETQKWTFKIIAAPTPGRFVILAFDDWGRSQGWI